MHACVCVCVCVCVCASRPARQWCSASGRQAFHPPPPPRARPNQRTTHTASHEDTDAGYCAFFAAMHGAALLLGPATFSWDALHVMLGG
jgi:hypothetical protein